MNLYNIKIGIDRFNPEIQAIGELESCWQIYWNFMNSVQSIESEFYVSVMHIESGSYIDITKGCRNDIYVSQEPLLCSKNHEYMVDRVNSIKRKK